MAIFDQRSSELICKVVFCGPVGAGVGTTFRELWALIPDAADSAVIPGPGDPPVYELHYRTRPATKVDGKKVVFHLVGYEAEPIGPAFVEILRDLDGYVLVMDSGPTALRSNMQARQNIDAAMGSLGAGLATTPGVIQYNKRDLPDALSIRQLERSLNVDGVPYVATSANRAQGLQDLLARVAGVVSVQVQMPVEQQQPPLPQPMPPAVQPEPAAPVAPPPGSHAARAPTASRTQAFERAEQQMFGRGIASQSLGQPDEADEDRTVLGAQGASPYASRPAPQPSIPSSSPENDPTILGAQPANPFAPAGAPPQQPSYPPPVQQPTPSQPPRYEQPAPTPLPVPNAAPPQAQPPAAQPWENPQAAPPPVAPVAPAVPQPQQPPVSPDGQAPITVQSPPVHTSPVPDVPAAEQTVAPWDAPAGNEREIAAPDRKKAAREMISVPVTELTGQSAVRVGEARVHGPTTVALPLTLRTGARERNVQLLLELGGPAGKGAQPVAGPSTGRSVPLGWFLTVAAALVVVGVVLVATSIF